MVHRTTPRDPLTASPVFPMARLRLIKDLQDLWDPATLRFLQVTPPVLMERLVIHQAHQMALGLPTVQPMLSITPVLLTTRQDGLHIPMVWNKLADNLRAINLSEK